MNNYLLFSVGDIGRKLGMPLYQINYYLDVLGVEPTARIAGKRVYSEDVVNTFKKMLMERKLKKEA